MRWLAWFLALCLIGCGGLSTAAARYLKQSEPFQKDLTQYQVQIKQASKLPWEQRAQRTRELLAQLQTQHGQLQKLKPPRSVTSVHRELDQLYTTMDLFLQACLAGRGDASDPKVRQLSGEWTQHLDQLQLELQKLEARP